MTTTITHGATVLEPMLVLGYRYVREIGNQSQKIIDRQDLEISFEEAGLRSGTLTFLCANYTTANALEELHVDVGLFTLTDTELSGLNMTYVPRPDGRIEAELDDRTRTRWIVRVDFQEVAS